HHRALHSFPTRRSSDLHRSPLVHQFLSKRKSLSIQLHRHGAPHKKSALVGPQPNGRSRPSAHSMISAARKCHASILPAAFPGITDRKSTRLNSSHLVIS